MDERWLKLIVKNIKRGFHLPSKFSFCLAFPLLSTESCYANPDTLDKNRGARERSGFPFVRFFTFPWCYL